MKKMLGLFLVLTMAVFIVVGYLGEGVSAKEEVVLLFSHDNHPGDPVQEAALYWADLLEKESNGTMKIRVFPSGQLGSKSDLIDQMLAGDAIVAIGNGPFYADRGAPDLGIMQAPYLFKSWEQLDKLVESDWMRGQERLLEQNGLKIIAHNWRYGTRHTLTTSPIKEPEDLKGMKIRTQSSTVHIKGFEALGATPTPMTLNDVYTALQQGIIEGVENPLSVLYSGKFQEVAKYLMLDGHIRDLSSIVISYDFFNSLTKQQQDILMDTCKKAGLYHNELAKKAEQESLRLLQEEGVKVTEVNYTDFEKAAESFYSDPKIQALFSDGLVEQIRQIIE